MSEPNSYQMKTISARPTFPRRPPTDDDDDEMQYWEEPKRAPTFPTKAAFIAVFLFVVGITFGIVGLVTALKSSLSDATPFIVIAGITLIPGSFYSFILLCAYLGRPGYSYDQIPNRDD